MVDTIESVLFWARLTPMQSPYAQLYLQHSAVKLYSELIERVVCVKIN